MKAKYKIMHNIGTPNKRQTHWLNDHNRLVPSFIRLQTTDSFLVALISIVEVRLGPHQRNF